MTTIELQGLTFDQLSALFNELYAEVARRGAVAHRMQGGFIMVGYPHWFEGDPFEGLTR